MFLYRCGNKVIEVLNYGLSGISMQNIIPDRQTE